MPTKGFDAALTAQPDNINELYESVASVVERRLDEQRISLGIDPELDLPCRPDGEPYSGPPRDLSGVSNNDLANIMWTHVQYMNYLNNVTAVAQSKKVELQAQLKALASSIEQQRGKAAVASDVRYVCPAARVAEHESLIALLENKQRNAREAYKALSRIVALRGIDIESNARVNNVSRGHWS